MTHPSNHVTASGTVPHFTAESVSASATTTTAATDSAPSKTAVSVSEAPTDFFLVTLLPGGWHFPVRDGQTVLAAALQAGIDLPSSCRNGTCRSCLCRLCAGQVRHTVEWPGLSAEEKAEGCILPCIALAHSDLVIDAPRASAKGQKDQSVE